MADNVKTEPSSGGLTASNTTAADRRASITKGRRGSNTFERPVQKVATVRYMPTYRLEPKVPFNTEICEKIMKEVMDQGLDTFSYSQKHSLGMCSQLSEEIKNRVKARNFDRYRYVVIVTIGEKVMQGFYAMTNFLWDATRDGYLKYIYDTPQFFAIATLYYIYYD